MKKSTITVRIENDLKQAFQDICTNEYTDMSDKLHQFIVSEIKTKNAVQWKAYLTDIIRELGYSNWVRFIDQPYLHLNVGKPNERHYTVASVKINKKFTFKDFLIKNKDHEIYIYLGNDMFPGELRTIVI
jgi:hypothetical protein